MVYFDRGRLGENYKEVIHRPLQTQITELPAPSEDATEANPEATNAGGEAGERQVAGSAEQKEGVVPSSSSASQEGGGKVRMGF